SDPQEIVTFQLDCALYFETADIRFLLKEFAQGEDEFAVAVVADGGGHGDNAQRGLGDDAEVDVLAGDGGQAGGAHLSGFVGGSDVDALAERAGQAGDAAEKDWFDEEVVGAAVLADGAGGEAERASEGEAEGLGDVAVEHGPALRRHDEDVLADFVGVGELGAELW